MLSPKAPKDYFPKPTRDFNVKKEFFVIEHCDTYIFWRYTYTWKNGLQYTEVLGACSVMNIINQGW